MGAGRVLFLAVFVALLCVLASNNSEGNGKFSQRFSDNGDSWDVTNIDEYTAEKVLSYCTKELRDSTEAIEEFNLYLPQSTLSRYNIIANLPPKKKEAIMNCLRDQAIASQIPTRGDETFLNKYQNLLSSWASVPRRLLRRKRHHHRIRRTAASPSPGPSPGPIFFLASLAEIRIREVPAPSPSPVIQPAPYPAPQVPIEAPEPSSPEVSPMAPSMPDGDSPSMPDGDSPSMLDGDSPSILPQAMSPFPPGNNSIIHSKYVVAVIAAGVVAGIGFVALFLSCCLNRNRSKIEPKESQRDEKPLLNCCSDVSGGSSNKTQCTSNVCMNNLKAPLSNTINHDSTEAESHKSEILGEPSDQSTSNLPLPPGRIVAAPPPPPGPPPAPPKPPAPAPPPRVSRPPNPPRRSPLGPHHGGHSSTNQGSDDSEAPKAKLKPFFWDKVLASSNQSMVWHEIKAGSFQFNEEMMENLFGYAQPAKNKNEQNKDSSFETPQLIQIINPKKSQNLAILLKALNVTTEEVCDALEEGNELPAELIQTLLKMAPTSEEELKLRLYSGDVSHLGPAERFLKILVEIPFAFKRLESLLFINIYQEEVSTIKEAHSTLEVACKELKNSRLFLKLLEAVLKTGNRMNDGTYRGGAQAFKLETLLKLSDVKGTDGKTTLLHFVVQEIIRSEGLRAARRLRQSQSISSSVRTDDLIEDSSNETEEYHRNLGLQVVARLSNELENVRKAALIDNETLATSLSKIATSLVSTKEFLAKEMKEMEGESEFRDALVGFVEHAEADVASLLEEEKRIMGLVKNTVDYFHGRAGKDDGSRLFVIIRDFLLMLDKVCREVKNSSNKLPMKPLKKEVLTTSPSQESRHESSSGDYRNRLFPAIRERHVDEDFNSDDER